MTDPAEQMRQLKAAMDRPPPPDPFEKGQILATTDGSFTTFYYRGPEKWYEMIPTESTSWAKVLELLGDDSGSDPVLYVQAEAGGQ